MVTGFGAYGKIPAAGDFLRIAVPPGFAEPWDRWLQRVLLTAEEEFRAHWVERYMTAPIWRFSLSPGLAGPSAAAGVLMPSVDRVGRRFPLTLVAGLEAGPRGGAARLHFAAGPLFAKLEELALAALDDTMTPEKLREALAVYRPPGATPALTSLRRVGTTVYGIGASPLHAGMAAAFIGATEETQSLWTAELNGVSRAILCTGLPGRAEIPALFDMTAAAWNEEENV